MTARMLQPTKNTLRQTLAHAADSLAEKNLEIDRLAEQLDLQFWKGAMIGGSLIAGVFVALWWLT